ncbi:MAG: FliM/FliN family flagellar motor switch protein [Planctomycetes bacterium]|nr:FliM/FliN family flagellar motor switch protein [Planctomycetota bacterium]
MSDETIQKDETTTAAPETHSDATPVATVDFEDLGVPTRVSASPENFGRILDVSVPVTARVGVVRKTISDVVDLVAGTIIDLERPAGAPIDLVIGEKLIARGEIVVVDDRYGIRIVEVIQD